MNIVFVCLMLLIHLNTLDSSFHGWTAATHCLTAFCIFHTSLQAYKKYSDTPMLHIGFPLSSTNVTVIAHPHFFKIQ